MVIRKILPFIIRWVNVKNITRNVVQKLNSIFVIGWPDYLLQGQGDYRSDSIFA